MIKNAHLDSSPVSVPLIHSFQNPGGRWGVCRWGSDIPGFLVKMPLKHHRNLSQGTVTSTIGSMKRCIHRNWHLAS